ncbi:hypothetical protein NL676_027580 [Syzygium grande]|nr:hypothetical protein NL676_027580 [Syzygium grande]
MWAPLALIMHALRHQQECQSPSNHGEPWCSKKYEEEKEFKVVLKPNVAGKPVDYVFGRLIWSDGVHYVRSPLVVKHQ